jgi:hypothetical protein
MCLSTCAGPLNYNPVEEHFFHRIKAGRPIPVPGSGMQVRLRQRASGSSGGEWKQQLRGGNGQPRRRSRSSGSSSGGGSTAAVCAGSRRRRQHCITRSPARPPTRLDLPALPRDSPPSTRCCR